MCLAMQELWLLVSVVTVNGSLLAGHRWYAYSGIYILSSTLKEIVKVGPPLIKLSGLAHAEYYLWVLFFFMIYRGLYMKIGYAFSYRF